MQGHSEMDILKQLVSVNGYQCFTDISLQLFTLLWISICLSLDFYGYPSIDLLYGFSFQSVNDGLPMPLG